MGYTGEVYTFFNNLFKNLDICFSINDLIYRNIRVKKECLSGKLFHSPILHPITEQEVYCFSSYCPDVFFLMALSVTMCLNLTSLLNSMYISYLPMQLVFSCSRHDKKTKCEMVHRKSTADNHICFHFLQHSIPMLF